MQYTKKKNLKCVIIKKKNDKESHLHPLLVHKKPKQYTVPKKKKPFLNATHFQ